MKITRQNLAVSAKMALPFTVTLIGLMVGIVIWEAAAKSINQMGRVKLAIDPATNNPPGTYHVIYGSTNPAHMSSDKKMLAPIKAMLVSTNVVALSNMMPTVWYFFAEARYSNQVSLPSPVLQVWLLAPPGSMSIKEQFPGSPKPVTPVE